MEKLKAIWNTVADSLWFVPGMFTLAAGALAILLIRYNDEIIGETDADEVWWLFGGSAEGAKSVLESISGSIITVTGVVFSVTIIALQLASSQFTPRVLRQYMADRANQIVLGVFIGTFTYTLLVQRTVRSGEVGDEFIPGVAVTGAVVLALTSIGFLIYYINHAARSIQASVIIDGAVRDTLKAVRRIFPQELDRPDTTVPDATIDREDEPHHVEARTAGYVQALDRARLRKRAIAANVTVRLETEIGAHVLPGQRVMSVWPAAAVDAELEKQLRSALVLGSERTPHQDIKHGIIELMDIAVKAMSIGVNDPTTATNAVQRMAEVLLELAWREGGDDVTKDDSGRQVVLVRRPRLDDVTGLGFNQLRHYAASNPTFAVMLMETLGELAALSPEPARAPFLDQLRQVSRTAHQGIENEQDLARVDRAMAAALARAASPPPAARPHG
jgi:uncharacterized membrane protein